jgi:carbamoyltransferase
MRSTFGEGKGQDMPVNVLGISAFYHDSAAALVRDGEIVAAAQEERFSRKKHDPRFPRHAVNYCLEEAFLDPRDLNAVVFYDHPLLTLDRVMRSLLSVAPKGEEQWLQAAPSTLGTKLNVVEQIREMLQCDVRVMFARHHLSHAASAFYPSPFKEAAILTLDGVGEWATTSIAEGKGNQIRIHKEIHYPHSLGLLYSAFTYFCGFKVNSGEYKLMGLAPYGKPRFADRIREKLVHVRPDGSFHLSTGYFGFMDSNVMTNELFDELFEGPPRKAESRITRREMDLAASIQQVTEEMVLGLARHTREITGQENLTMAGGVALNCVANGKLLKEKIFRHIWIQPAAGDAGGALGAALLGNYRVFGVERKPSGPDRDSQKASYLGPAFSSHEARAYLDRLALPYQQVTDRQERARRIAEELAAGKVVGFFSGRMEFGPRALGSRSILGDPRRADTQATMNLKIKFRESFRPFAPTVLAERCSDFFELQEESPYMLLVAPIREERRRATNGSGPKPGDDDLLQVVRQERSDLPAITHVDYSARIQTLRREDHPDYYAVIEEFGRLTSYPVVVNTSFNVRGEPLVCTPEDAYRCFMRTEMDALVLEDCILSKAAQPAWKDPSDWKKEFELD